MEIFIRKNNKKESNNKYIGFIGKKVAFLPTNFELPSYLTEGRYDFFTDSKNITIENRGNHYVIHKIKMPSIYDIIEIPEIAFKNKNTVLTEINNVPVKIAKNYIEISINNNKCRIASFKRCGNNRDVDMTLINVNDHMNVLNDKNVFNKGTIKKKYFNEIVKILNCNYSSGTLLYLVSELMWLNFNLYLEVFEKIKNRKNKKDIECNIGIIDDLSRSNYGLELKIDNLNIKNADIELKKILN